MSKFYLSPIDGRKSFYGKAVVKSVGNRMVLQSYNTDVAEYDRDTLSQEYYRDLSKGMNPKIPVNYFPDDDPTKEPVVNWRSAGQLLYTNWLNYYVYQATFYDLEQADWKE